MTRVGWRTWLLAGAALAGAGSACANGSPDTGPGAGGALGQGAASTSSTGQGGQGGKSGTGGGTGSGGGCATAADCPSPADACTVATCNAGACGTKDAPQGTVASQDVPADCHSMICDGMGHAQKGIDVTNVPTSSDACLAGTCDVTGAPGTAPTAAGTPCSAPPTGQLCDGGGNCVQCLHDGDCPAGMTCGALNACMGSPCMDQAQDGNETDIDCGGGTCPTCGTGKMCEVDADCTSGACDPLVHTCLSPMCSNNMKDGNETDVDCGGSCSACALGKGCMADQDCLSLACDALSLTCVADQCSDHRQEPSETDVDCGGSTSRPCELGQTCKHDTDCASDSCDTTSTHTCIANVNPCTDNMQDGLETDIDCGGGTCPGCVNGKKCGNDLDCISGGCDYQGFTCVADPCSDHHQDNDETDVDCGGSCPPCAVGKMCNTSTDCQAGHTCTATIPHVCK